MGRSRSIAWLGVVSAVVALAAPVAASASSTRHSLAAKITVTFTDKKLVVTPGHLEAGTATVLVVNKGQKLHVLTINGPGLKNGRTQKVQPGRTMTLTVTLKTGAYQLADPFGVAGSNVGWLVVSPATVVKSTGNGSVVVPLTDPTRMDCD